MSRYGGRCACIIFITVLASYIAQSSWEEWVELIFFFSQRSTVKGRRSEVQRLFKNCCNLVKGDILIESGSLRPPAEFCSVSLSISDDRRGSHQDWNDRYPYLFAPNCTGSGHQGTYFTGVLISASLCIHRSYQTFYAAIGFFEPLPTAGCGSYGSAF